MLKAPARVPTSRMAPTLTRRIVLQDPVLWAPASFLTTSRFPRANAASPKAKNPRTAPPTPAQTPEPDSRAIIATTTAHTPIAARPMRNMAYAWLKSGGLVAR